MIDYARRAEDIRRMNPEARVMPVTREEWAAVREMMGCPDERSAAPVSMNGLALVWEKEGKITAEQGEMTEHETEETKRRRSMLEEAEEKLGMRLLNDIYRTMYIYDIGIGDRQIHD
jgi:hypothetical protein